MHKKPPTVTKNSGIKQGQDFRDISINSLHIRNTNEEKKVTKEVHFRGMFQVLNSTTDISRRTYCAYPGYKAAY